MKKILKRTGKIILILIALLVVLFAAGYLLTMGEYKVPETVTDDPTLPSVTIAGVTFHAETFGEKSNPVVVVVHGGPGFDYKGLLPLKALADQYYVIFYDQRGGGLSPRVEADQLNLVTCIDDLNRIVDYLGGGRKVRLIGHSWGAMLTSAFLGKYPLKVTHAVLAEPGFLTPESAAVFMKKTNHMRPSFSFKMLYLAGKAWFQSLHINAPDENAAGDYLLGQLMSADFDGSPVAGYFCNGDFSPSKDYWRVGSVAANAILTSGMDEDGNLNVNFVEGIKHYAGKVLFMASQCNTIIGVEHQKKLMRHFSNPQLVVLKDCGHYMFGEKPDECVAILRDFFKIEREEEE